MLDLFLSCLSPLLLIVAVMSGCCICPTSTMNSIMSLWRKSVHTSINQNEVRRFSCISHSGFSSSVVTDNLGAKTCASDWSRAGGQSYPNPKPETALFTG